MAKQLTINNVEKSIKKEESILKKEIIKEEKGIEWFIKSHTFRLILLIGLFIVSISAIIYLTINQGLIKIEKSEVSAPIISLSPQTSGVLQKVFVKEGDFVAEDTIVAQVNDIPIKTQTSGLIVSVDNSPGKFVSTTSPIVQMIEPKQLRVVGHIQEDKGLKDIRVGQRVVFSVDAYPGKKYNGVVELVVPSARQSVILFSISDKREEKEFDVKVKFDSYFYSELKNGMSAKIKIYK